MISAHRKSYQNKTNLGNENVQYEKMSILKNFLIFETFIKNLEFIQEIS